MEVATNDILQQKLLPKSVMKDIELKVGVKGNILFFYCPQFCKFDLPSGRNR